MPEERKDASAGTLGGEPVFPPLRTDSSADSTITSAGTPKLCCMCGADVHGKTRYKDSGGRYWCAACNDADVKRRQPATCPDCSKEMTFGDLIEFKGTPVCQACWEKRRQSAKREEARLRAIELEAEQQRLTRRKWILAAITAFTVLVIYGIVMLFLSLGHGTPVVPGR